MFKEETHPYCQYLGLTYGLQVINETKKCLQSSRPKIGDGYETNIGNKMAWWIVKKGGRKKDSIIIKDPLGTETGIVIFDLCYNIEEESDQIRSYGYMEEVEGAVLPSSEPEILCCWKNSEDRLLYAACSIHLGHSHANHYAMFLIEISVISRKCVWDAIDSKVLSAYC